MPSRSVTKAEHAAFLAANPGLDREPNFICEPPMLCWYRIVGEQAILVAGYYKPEPARGGCPAVEEEWLLFDDRLEHA